MLLSPTSLASAATGRPPRRQRANASTESQGQQERFVLPEHPEQDAAGADSPAAKPKAGQAQTHRSDKRSGPADPPKVPTKSPAVNLLAIANQPEATVAGPINPVPLTVLNALDPMSKPTQAARPIAATSSKAGALVQPSQGASRSSAGPAQAIVGPAVGPMTALTADPQGAGDARIGLPAQSQSPLAQAAAAMTPGAKASAEQAAEEALTSRARQTSDLSGGTAKPAGPAAATAGSAASIPAGAGLDASTAAKAAIQPGHEQMRQSGPRSLSDILQQSVESAVSGKSAAGLDSAMPTGAKALAQLEQTQKARGVPLPEAARPVQTQGTETTNVLAGSWGHVRGDQSIRAADLPAGEPAPVAIARPAEQIIENVRQAIQNGQREVTINLNPPELGRVRMRLYTEGDDIRGRLEVDNPRSFHEIRQQAELLTQRLMGEGIPVRRLDVHLSPTGSQTASFSSPQHDEAGQGAWGQPGDGNGAAGQGRNRQVTEQAGAGPAIAAAEADVGDSLSGEGLNVWI